MAALKLMVDTRARTGRPAPESTSAADRSEFETSSRALLLRLRERFLADLPADLRAGFDRAEAAVEDGPARPLAGQVFLARHLADYWQRFERFQLEDAQARLADRTKPGWMRRLLGQGPS